METDRDLAFGVLAFRSKLIDSTQLAEACAEWGAQKDAPLAEILIRRGWLDADDRGRVEERVRRSLQPDKGDSLSRQSDNVVAEVDATNVTESDKTVDLSVEEIERVSDNDDSVHTVDIAIDEDEPSGKGAEADSRVTIDVIRTDITVDLSAHVIERGVASQDPGNTIDFPPNANAGSNERRKNEDTIFKTSEREKHGLVETIDWGAEHRSRYALSRLHGRGGLGQVWLAIDRDLNREVALKEVLPERSGDAEKIGRFVKEAQITGQLEHPSIIPVYELAADSSGGKPFYTMRFVRGDTLSERINKYHAKRSEGNEEPLELQRLLQAFVGVCYAIGYAESKGVVHRDLKPANIMTGAFGEVIVLDWGLARLVNQPDDEDEIENKAVELSAEISDTSKTMAGQVVGSPAYMSPEQARGRLDLIDGRTDVYGLGAVLFNILTGQPPHRGTKTGNSLKDTIDLLGRISAGEIPKAKEVLPSVPSALSAVCGKAMAKRRSHRYQKASDLAEDVERWLADEPVSAYTEPLRARASRWMRRHRTWTQAIGAALVLVATISIVAVLVINNALQKEAAAKRRAEESLKKEQAALASEKDAKAEAVRRFREARRAVDRALTGTSEVLSQYPGSLGIRTRLLEEAANDYERYSREKSEEPELRAEFGRALVRLGDVRRMLNDHEKAKKAYRPAESLFRELSEQDPKNLDLRMDLAITLNKQGVVHGELNETPEAEKAYERAVEIFDQLRAESDDPKYGDAYARALITRARSLIQVEKYELAKGLLETAIAELQKIAGEFKGDEYVYALATARKDLAVVLWKNAENVAAAEVAKKAISSLDRLVQEDPKSDHPEYFEARAACEIELANSLNSLGRDDERAEIFDLAIGDYEDLLTARPGVPIYLENLAVARVNLAQVLHNLGRNAEARDLAYQALEVFVEMRGNYPKFPRYQIEEAVGSSIYGQILGGLGEDKNAASWLENAVVKFDELAAANSGNSGQTLYLRQLAICERLLGRQLHKMGQLERAKVELLRAVEDFEEVLKLAADNPVSQNERALCYTHTADLLRDLDMSDVAQSFYKKAFDIRWKPSDRPEHLFQTAALFANCRDVNLREPKEAIKVAKQATSLVPNNGKYWYALGLAHFRNDDWKQSIDALNKATLYRKFENSFDYFCLAMAYFKSGELDKSKTAFERAMKTDQMKENQGNIELLWLRADATKLLGEIIPPLENDDATDKTKAGND